jgi:hypothetical protein
MSAAWAAVIVAIAMFALAVTGLSLQLAADARRRGVHQGKIDTALENLAWIVSDHERRIRGQESRRYTSMPESGTRWDGPRHRAGHY